MDDKTKAARFEWRGCALILGGVYVGMLASVDLAAAICKAMNKQIDEEGASLTCSECGQYKSSHFYVPSVSRFFCAEFKAKKP